MATRKEISQLAKGMLIILLGMQFTVGLLEFDKLRNGDAGTIVVLIFLGIVTLLAFGDSK